MVQISVLLSNLYDNVVDRFSIKLVAGENGLNNVVKWIHMVENLEISSFLDGQEIVFTTGIGISSSDELFELIKENVKNNASAMVVNIGPYIKEITKEMIAFCDEVNFPLFIVPWQVKMHRIIKIFCSYILEAEKKEVEISGALKSAVFSPNQVKLYEPVLERYGFRSESVYRVAIIKTTNHNKSKEYNEVIKLKIEYILRSTKRDTIVVEVENNFVLFFINTTRDKVKGTCISICDYLNNELTEMLFFAAIGDETKEISTLFNSYKQALFSLKLQNTYAQIDSIIEFSEIGAYKILSQLTNNVELQTYIKDTIGPLVDYDKLNNTDYVSVLQSYLHLNGRVNEVAKLYYSHRNTINYKIKRIGRILDCDLSDFSVRFNIELALMLRNIFRSDE